MILTFFGFLARVGVFISAIITLGLNGKFFTNTEYSDDLLIYIIALASFSALACLVPPYPNFVYDLFWALANAICAVFALVVQVSSLSLLVIEWQKVLID
jgi:tellurite resistance protein TehA-like permease